MTTTHEHGLDRVERARELVAACLDLPMVLDGIGDADDLVAGGLNSGELLVVALRCEDALGRGLADDELSRLTTITAIAELLDGE